MLEEFALFSLFSKAYFMNYLFKVDNIDFEQIGKVSESSLKLNIIVLFSFL